MCKEQDWASTDWTSDIEHYGMWSFGLITLCCADLLSRVRLCNPVDCSPPCSFVRGDSPGKNTGADCHALLQGIFPTQESNWDLLHWREILYQPSYQGSP